MIILTYNNTTHGNVSKIYLSISFKTTLEILQEKKYFFY